MTNVIQLSDYHRTRCCVCGRTACEGDCPVSQHRTFHLNCDLCGDATRILTEDMDIYVPEFLAAWKQEHAVHHVYLDPPGKYGPPVVGAGPFVHITPCRR